MFKYKRVKREGAIKRIRSKFGKNTQYELLLFCSSRNIYAQIIDLRDGKTQFSLSTCKKGENKKNHRNIEQAKILGKLLAEKCKSNNITNVSFNRAEKIFHGVVKAVADGFYQI